MVVTNSREIFAESVAALSSALRSPAYDVAAKMAVEKRHDYAGSNHAFVNFEFMAALTGLSVSDVFRFYNTIKPTRLLTLSDSDKPKFETGTDSVQDGMMYLSLYYSWLIWTYRLGASYQPTTPMNYTNRLEFVLARRVSYVVDLIDTYHQEGIEPDEALFNEIVSALELYRSVGQNYEGA